MITCQVERFRDIAPELRVFVDPQWREVASFPDDFRHEISWESYSAADAKGILFTATARDSDSLVGYFVGFWAPDWHRPDVKMLAAKSHFMRPEYRARVARRFFLFIEREAIAQGCNWIAQRSKPDANEAYFFFEALGYRLTEVVQSKILLPQAPK